MVRSLYRGLVVLAALLAAMPGIGIGTYVGAQDVPECNTRNIGTIQCKGSSCPMQVSTCFGCPNPGGGATLGIVCKNVGSACQGGIQNCTANQFNVADGGSCIVQDCGP